MGSAGAGDMLTKEQIDDCRLNKSMSAEVRKALCGMALLLLEVRAKIEKLGPSVTIAALGDDLLKRIKEATC